MMNETKTLNSLSLPNVAVEIFVRNNNRRKSNISFSYPMIRRDAQFSNVNPMLATHRNTTHPIATSHENNKIANALTVIEDIANAFMVTTEISQTQISYGNESKMLHKIETARKNFKDIISNKFTE